MANYRFQSYLIMFHHTPSIYRPKNAKPALPGSGEPKQKKPDNVCLEACQNLEFSERHKNCRYYLRIGRTSWWEKIKEPVEL
jgi:hypothetical protein